MLNRSYNGLPENNREYFMLVLTRRNGHFLSINNDQLQIYYCKKRDRFYIDGPKDIPIIQLKLDESRSFQDFKKKQSEPETQRIDS
jgi:sRNA-binding carbon storage regulator CsrA